MDLKRGALLARKAWFFFDDVYVCLGAGITIENGNPVATSINQCRFAEPVRGKPSDGWVHHHDVGYIFRDGGSIRLSSGPQTGRWPTSARGPASR